MYVTLLRSHVERVATGEEVCEPREALWSVETPEDARYLLWRASTSAHRLNERMASVHFWVEIDFIEEVTPVASFEITVVNIDTDTAQENPYLIDEETMIPLCDEEEEGE